MPVLSTSPVSHAVRAFAAAAAALAVAVMAATGVAARSYDSVERLDTLPPGTVYRFFVREVDVDHNPLAGRQVHISVLVAPGAGASVAASDAAGNPTGPAAVQTDAVSGADGRVYFLLQTSQAQGENDFVWDDGTSTGEVVAMARVATAAARPAAPPAASNPTGSHRGGFPPLVGGLLSGGLATVVTHLLVNRRRPPAVRPALREEPAEA